VSGCGRIDIFEGEDVLVFFDNGGRDFACNNFIEKSCRFCVADSSEPNSIPAARSIPFLESPSNLEKKYKQEVRHRNIGSN
jgi:hypothetical protein